MGRKTKKKKLPKELIAIPNDDKKFHEKWKSGRDLLNFPHPFRGVFMGPPNMGKSTTVKNLVIRAKPQFEEVLCVHCDPEFTQEYDDIGATMLGEIPAPTEFEGEVKTLVIIDDLDIKNLNKDQKSNLDRLFGFVSTHKNISVCLCTQDVFNLQPNIRRCANLWVLWRSVDLDSMATIARKGGMAVDSFKGIFEDLMKEPRDSLWIDMTPKSPAPMRKNGYQKLCLIKENR